MFSKKLITGVLALAFVGVFGAVESNAQGRYWRGDNGNHNGWYKRTKRGGRSRVVVYRNYEPRYRSTYNYSPSYYSTGYYPQYYTTYRSYPRYYSAPRYYSPSRYHYSPERRYYRPRRSGVSIRFGFGW